MVKYLKMERFKMLSEKKVISFNVVLLLFVFNITCSAAVQPEALKGQGRNLALGKSYTCNPAPDAFPKGYNGRPMCKDKGDIVQLTDGELAVRCWWDKRTVGWWWDKRVDITVDLGKVEAVDAVAVHFSSERTGARVPRKVLVFSSNDEKNFHLAGELTSDEAFLQWDENQDKEGRQDGNPHCWLVKKGLKTKGRFITLSFWATSLYLDEIQIFSGNLKAADIKINEKDLLNSIDTMPLIGYDKLHIPREICIPVKLKIPRRMSYKLNEGLCVHLDLPEGIILKGPKSVEPVTDVVEGDNKWKRHTITKAREIFLQSELPEGTVSKMRMVARDTGCEEKRGKVQLLDVETISIPKTPMIEKLRVSVGFDRMPFWIRWPDVAKHYKHMGFNIFMPFFQHDGYWYILKSDGKDARAIIKQGQDAGLIVGAWSSPFCNPSLIHSLKKFGGHKAVYLNSGKKTAVACPRTYFNPQKEGRDPDGEIARAEALAAYGVEFHIFDSEPNWLGEICSCPDCRKEWKAFLSKRKIKFRNMKEIYKSAGKSAEDKKYKNLMQDFWDEFYCEMWGAFKTKMVKAAPKGTKITLGLYSYPKKAASLTHHYLGNHGSFLPFYNKRILDFAAPENYVERTKDFGALIRDLRKKLPASCPIYPIVSCGGSWITWDRSALDLKHRLYEILCNGGQGFHLWSIGGASGDDLKTVSKIIGTIKPHEDLIVEGKLIPIGTLVTNDDSVKANGITSGQEAMIIVSRYGKSSTAAAKVRINSKKLGFKPTVLKSLDNTEGLEINGNMITVEFNGTPEDFVKVFYIK